MIYSRERGHCGELNEDVFSDGSSSRGLLRRRKLVLGTESLRLENVVLPDDSLITLVGHHQHRHLGGGEITLQTSHQNIDRPDEFIPDIS